MRVRGMHHRLGAHTSGRHATHARQGHASSSWCTHIRAACHPCASGACIIVLVQSRLRSFLSSPNDGPFHASDGKMTSPETIRQAVRQLRSQYFTNGTDLRLFNTECILNELLEFAQADHMHKPAPQALPRSYTPDPRAISSALVAAVAPGRLGPSCDGPVGDGLAALNVSGAPPPKRQS